MWILLSQFLTSISMQKGCETFKTGVPCRNNNNKSVGPGLAQLVERLAHRYSENMSSNPGNLPLQQYVGTGPATRRPPRGRQL